MPSARVFRRSERNLNQITGVVGNPLRWTQPRAHKREFELRSGTDVVATLAFRSFFGSSATVRSGDGSWTFKRVGFWRPRVRIRAEKSAQDLGIFVSNPWSNGGTLQLAEGREFRAKTNFWA